MNTNLFDDFDPVSAKQWKQKIQVDLKGADYNDTLIWQSLEGIHVKPTYHADHFESTPTPIPGHPDSWSIVQEVFLDDAKIANRLILDAIARGAEAVMLIAHAKFDVATVFNKFPFEQTPIHFDLRFLDEVFISELKAFLSSAQATVYYNLDILGHFANTGTWFHRQETDHTILSNQLDGNKDQHMISIDASLYQNAGANVVQQLAYALAHANEYLNYFCGTNTNDQQEFPLSFKVAIGSNYFFEIAKLRALRILYARLASEYNCTESCTIMAMPSKRNKTIYDYNVNMLRTTTEVMSAALGGADAICNMRYDALYHKSNEFGERIARNQLLILKHESYFDMVANPADGSYYIESLTQQLAEKALEIFKSIEQGGGLMAQLKSGTIQQKIKESAYKEQAWFDEGKLVLLGTNKYPNDNDHMQHDLELYPFLKIKVRKTEIEPIVTKRLSEKIEKERLENEK